MRRGLVAGLSSSVVLAVGCNARPVTEVVVVVHTTYAVPAELDGVSITVARAGSGTTTSTGAWTDASQPRVLGLVHDGGALGPIDVSVAGMLRATALVERQASFSFVRGEIRRLDLWLVPECAAELRACRGAETCDPGPTCRDPQAGPAELAPWTGSVAGLDASVAEDTAALDAGATTPCCPSGAPGVVATSCAGASCVIVECQPALAHCDTNVENGCETRLDSRNDCGRCGRRCTGGTTCTMVGGSYDCR